MRSRFTPLRPLLLLAAAAIPFSCQNPGRAAPAGPPVWKSLVDGLDYRTAEEEGTLVHLVKVRLDRLELAVADARVGERDVATVDTLLNETRALAALNGTFFDDRRRPLGWVVTDGRERNPVRDISWWAAFVVEESEGRRLASIVPTAELRGWSPARRSQVRAALQVGPRTVVDGRAVKLKEQVAARSAVCLLDAATVVLLATDVKPMESNVLAKFMARAEGAGGLGCSGGLMFDGGPSTQLRLRTDALGLDIRGGWGVPNALLVRRPAVPDDPTR